MAILDGLLPQKMMKSGGLSGVLQPTLIRLDMKLLVHILNLDLENP